MMNAKAAQLLENNSEGGALQFGQIVEKVASASDEDDSSRTAHFRDCNIIPTIKKNTLVRCVCGDKMPASKLLSHW
eukprot:CAMPEP_0194279062 /NCGR_PEP_ID=MMETSP0169-20130528/13193_1 /TAXON_ID=218684 /ORGANISM="Corethron pennatum, Strain L29A3" /LENGTH=75 /DNA_ID=CAMNT_0039023421 /DNA_START=148 /DNA_END=372 /DNA_ORIENTATION=-